MNKDNVFHLRLDSDIREEIDERAKDSGITSSEWIRCAIDHYLENEGSEIPSQEELEDMKWEELEEVIDKLELEIDPADYDNSNFLSSPDENDTADLCAAIKEELGFSDDSEELEQETA